MFEHLVIDELELNDPKIYQVNKHLVKSDLTKPQEVKRLKEFVQYQLENDDTPLHRIKLFALGNYEKEFNEAELDYYEIINILAEY